ncbi:MAG: hypothetical protein HN341_10605 [Verrucomicrobia bacterium]|jgi:hypothetical protein|nr:hypothetical protein [Verrucomicrobiota bacterium]
MTEKRATSVEKKGAPTSCVWLIHQILCRQQVRNQFILVVLAVSSIVVAVVLALAFLLPRAAPYDVEVKESGTMLFKLPNRKRTAWVLLSPTGGEESPWVNTGLRLTKGKDVRITASGKICTAFHRMVDAARDKDDPLPSHPWVGPEGIDRKSNTPPKAFRTQDDKAEKFLLVPGKNQGLLIGTVSQGKPNVHPNDIWEIGVGDRFTAKDSGDLWLTVNDVWLERRRWRPYAASQKVGEPPKNKETFKKNIEDTGYYNIWFDDNAGAFLVIIEFL